MAIKDGKNWVQSERDKRNATYRVTLRREMATAIIQGILAGGKSGQLEVPEVVECGYQYADEILSQSREDE